MWVGPVACGCGRFDGIVESDSLSPQGRAGRDSPATKAGQRSAMRARPRASSPGAMSARPGGWPNHLPATTAAMSEPTPGSSSSGQRIQHRRRRRRILIRASCLRSQAPAPAPTGPACRREGRGAGFTDDVLLPDGFEIEVVATDRKRALCLPPSAVQTGAVGDLPGRRDGVSARKANLPGVPVLLAPSQGLLRHQAIVHAERSPRH